MIAYIPKPKQIDNSFLRHDNRTSFKYYNYATTSDKNNLKMKYLNEGYLALSFSYSLNPNFLYVYDFFNFELITSGNMDIDHNIEICNAEKISKFDTRLKKNIDVTNPKSILNCAHNLSPSSRTANQQLKKSLSKFKSLINDSCQKKCDICSLRTSGGLNVLISYSNINNIIFPSLYDGCLYLDDDFTIKYIGPEIYKAKAHIDRFQLNINKEAYLEIQKNLMSLQNNVPIFFTNPPRFYTTYLTLKKISNSPNQEITLKRMLRNIAIKLQQIG